MILGEKLLVWHNAFMSSLCDLTPEMLMEQVIRRGHPAYRAQQVLQWIYQKSRLAPSEMTNLPKSLRDSLMHEVPSPALKLQRVLSSNDVETAKFLWELKDQKFVESVLIRSGVRRTVCVSSQVGCPARCAFCASGRKGLFRNLSCGEIVEQVVLIGAHEPVSHVVFMGMGEPMRNLENVLEAISRLTDPRAFGLSARRITVSTVGVIEGIEEMTRKGLKVNLVLSLHAPNQKLRQRLIPYARQYPLDDLMASMEAYSRCSGRDITYEYTLMDGLNDQLEHAHELVGLLKGRQCTVNLIPYNPVEGLRLKRPSRKAIEAFRLVLNEAGIVNTCRYTKGDDIAAACGQLALQEPQIVTNPAGPGIPPESDRTHPTSDKSI